MGRSWIVVGVLVIACGKSGEPAPESTKPAATSAGATSEREITKKATTFGRPEVEALMREMCACADLRCADQVHESYRAWRRTGSNAQQHEAKTVMDELRDCRNSAVARSLDRWIVDVGAFKTRMCACADEPCAEAVQREYFAAKDVFEAPFIEAERAGYFALERRVEVDPQREKALSALVKEKQACWRTAVDATRNTPEGKLATTIATTERFRDQICGCLDTGCVASITEQLERWRAKAPAITPGPDDQAVLDKLAAELERCKTKKRR